MSEEKLGARESLELLFSEGGCVCKIMLKQKEFRLIQVEHPHSHLSNSPDYLDEWHELWIKFDKNGKWTDKRRKRLGNAQKASSWLYDKRREYEKSQFENLEGAKMVLKEWKNK